MNIPIQRLCVLTILACGVHVRSAGAELQAAAPARAPGRDSQIHEPRRPWMEKAGSAQLYTGRVEEVLPEGLVVGCGTSENNSAWHRQFLSGHPRAKDYSPEDRIAFRAFRDGSHSYQGADGNWRTLMKLSYCEETSSPAGDSSRPVRGAPPAVQAESTEPPPQDHRSEDWVVW